MSTLIKTRTRLTQASKASNRLRHVLATVGQWSIIIRTRRQLPTLAEHQLRDIGVTRAEAAREAGRPFWR